LSLGIPAVDAAPALDRGALAFTLEAALVRAPAGPGRDARALRRRDRVPEQAGEPRPGALAVGELAALLGGGHGEHAAGPPPGQPFGDPVPRPFGQRDRPPTSKESSTRLSAVLTDWPPGPDDREKRSRSSLPGITSQPFTGRSSGMGSG